MYLPYHAAIVLLSTYPKGTFLRTHTRIFGAAWFAIMKTVAIVNIHNKENRCVKSDEIVYWDATQK